RQAFDAGAALLTPNHDVTARVLGLGGAVARARLHGAVDECAVGSGEKIERRALLELLFEHTRRAERERYFLSAARLEQLAELRDADVKVCSRRHLDGRLFFWWRSLAAGDECRGQQERGKQWVIAVSSSHVRGVLV